MRRTLISLAAVLLAAVGWWGLYELTGKVGPDQAGAMPLFFALLFLALTATLAPPAAYLNRRLAPEAAGRDPWRFVRHSAWGGLCLTAWAWLQVHRVFNLGFALVIALIFVAVEFVIVRLKAES
ncbi:MAG: hypothetical protein JXM73_17420 [Anaerolineae bacterium]|nr:hypothetical protein [Anaerolineae bacterium]